MNSLAYKRFELVRTFRNARLLIFSLGFPLILFFVIAAPNRQQHNFGGTGISLPLYYTGGLVSLLALVSGTWFPLGHGFGHDIAQFLPSYWLVQASHVSLAGHGWAAGGWIVIAGWTAVLVLLARIAYGRDTGRV